MTLKDQIAAARALADVASPGPWKSNCRSINNPNGDPSWPEDDFLQFHVGTEGGGDIDIEGLVEGPKPVDWGRGEVYGRDAAFIAASRTLVPQLATLLERACELLERYERTCPCALLQCLKCEHARAFLAGEVTK